MSLESKKKKNVEYKRTTINKYVVEGKESIFTKKNCGNKETMGEEIEINYRAFLLENLNWVIKQDTYNERK